MPIEISSSDPEIAKSLREIADADSGNIECLTLKPMEGKEIITLIIENIDTISAGAAILITALRAKINSIRISKDGVEMSNSEKEDLLDDGKE